MIWSGSWSVAIVIFETFDKLGAIRKPNPY